MVRGHSEIVEKCAPTSEGSASVALAPSVRSGNWLKRGLSVWLVLHLFCLVMGPLGDGPLGETRLGKTVAAYLSVFELSDCWNFFSPNPAPPIRIDYELLNAQGEVDAQGAWPEKVSPFWNRDRQTRRVAVTDFAFSSEVRAEKIMARYFCARSPQPHSVRLWRVVEFPPSLSEVASGKRRIGDDGNVDRRSLSHTFCDQAGAG